MNNVPRVINISLPDNVLRLNLQLSDVHEETTMVISVGNHNNRSCNSLNGNGSEQRSPISLVQEKAVKLGYHPKYDIITENGPYHHRTYETKCTIGGCSVVGFGIGKRKSKIDAAAKMWRKIKFCAVP